VIAIDLGSNTLRVVQIDCKSMKIINEYEKTVKTADGLVQHGLINGKATTRVISAIKEAKEKIDFTSDTVKAVTTEAIRRAKNSDDVLLQIKKETGVAFKIISGEEEARLTLLAVKHRLAKLQYASDSFVLVDIGGGSTELIFHYDNEVISKSFPIGIVTIAQSYETLNTIQKALPKEMGQTYATYDAKKINGTSLEMKELDFYLKKLLSLPFEEREIAVGTGRSNLIAAGILIFKQLYSIVEFDACVVIDDGLREGVALEECSSLH